MLPSADDCDDCVPAYLQRRLTSVSASTLLFSSAPFVLTWIVVAAIAQRRLFPLLANEDAQRNEEGSLPTYAKHPRQSSTRSWPTQWTRVNTKRLASMVFSTSIGLSTVLVELLLCEISNALNPAARSLALRSTLTSLLLLGILVTPALEIHSLAKFLWGPSAQSTSTRPSRSRFRIALEVTLFAAWLLVFWYIPQASILRTTLHNSSAHSHPSSEHTFTEACLERIGIIGISLMASLSGFAAVSSLWQTFGVRHRPVRENDLSRREAGLAAAREMLGAKQSRLRALQRKISEAAPSEPAGFVGRVMGSLRSGTSDAQEVKALQMEVSGLETMQFSLSSSLANLRTRHAEQARRRTGSGQALHVCRTVFAVYCAYRICATSLSSVRRWGQPAHSFATSDPINNVLALLTTHWDGNLDRAAWSRQISFLLSGIMLLASFTAVLQTCRLFARVAPAWLRHAPTSLPLVISQIAGAYVISSALLLRSNLPEEFGGAISDALGAPLNARFVEGWFESWFLAAVGLTATGILIGRKVGGGAGEDWDEDDDAGVEMVGSKRS